MFSQPGQRFWQGPVADPQWPTALRVNLTWFHGVFAPNSKHRALITPATPDKGRKANPHKQCEEKTSFERCASMTWAQRLKRVFAIEIEICSECGGAAITAMPYSTARCIDCLKTMLPPNVTKRLFRNRNGEVPITCRSSNWSVLGRDRGSTQPIDGIRLDFTGEWLESRCGRGSSATKGFVKMGVYSIYTPTICCFIPVVLLMQTGKTATKPIP